jgi:hypothetical protein
MADTSNAGGPAPVAGTTPETWLHRLLGLSVPIVILAILYAIFISLAVFAAQVLRFSIPPNFKIFMFAILLLVSLGVFFSQVLRETFQFKHNGILVAGTLAFVVAFGYLIINYWEKIRDVVDPLEFTLAELRLDCDAEPGVQAANIYTVVSGDQRYIRELRKTLSDYRRQKKYDFSFVSGDDPNYDQLRRKASGESEWIAYSISQRDQVDRVIPLPTRLAANHHSTFLIDSVSGGAPTAASAEAAFGDRQSPEPETSELIEIAEVTIDPDAMDDEQPAQKGEAPEETLPETEEGQGLSGRANRVRIILKLNGNQTPCWSRAITRASQ